MQAFAEFIKSLGPGRILAMGGVTIALVAFFAYLIMRVAAPAMAPLFTDLSAEDSATIIKDLERQGISYEIRNDGATVMVPKDRVTRLRMKLAEGGLPKGGGVGYEIFDKTDVLGATNFVQNINHLRALEGELARTIKSLDRVQAARVHLVLPERVLFSRDKAEPTASIVLKVRGQLEAQQVRAIRHLVASAVNGLRPQRVSVVDEAGHLLADGSAEEFAGMSAQADERKVAFERRLRDQVEAIVASVVGPGRSHVQLTADFDFNRITQTSDKFDPEGRVVRSSQSKEEVTGSDGREGAVSVGNELPGSQARPDATQKSEQNRKTEEVVNYEISRTTKTEVIEGGRVNRISVAVVVDGNYTKNDKGEMVYEPRSKEEIERIAALVRSAIGFDAKRGDQVEVANLRLAELPANPIIEPTGFMSFLQFTKEDIMRVVELAVMLLLGIVVVLMVVRPMLRRIMTPAPATATQTIGEDGGVITTIQTSPSAAPIQIPTSKTAKMIDIAQVQGQVHAQSVQKVGELADKNPNETVSIIRTWLHEDAA